MYPIAARGATGPFAPAVAPVVVGHRGAPRRARENTPRAFAAAAAEGATWVELDVRTARDGLVVHHDPCTDDDVLVADQRMATLRARGVWSLQEVLAGLPAGLGVDVEVKAGPAEAGARAVPALAARLAPVLRAAADERPLCTSSFDVPTVAALVHALPEVPAGLLRRPSVRAASGLALAVELGARVLCPHALSAGLSRDLVGAAHAAGVAVLVWTVDRPARLRALAAIGVDAICTNEPAVAVAALRAPAGLAPG